MDIPVDIYLHPLTWRVLCRETDGDFRSVFLKSHWSYHLLVPFLRHIECLTKNDQRHIMNKNYKPGKVYISENDYSHRGGFLSERSMVYFSNVIYNRERDLICNLIMTAHVALNISREQAMQYYIDKFDLDFEDMNLPRLKKHYQRNFMQREQSYEEDIQQLLLTKRNKTKQ